MWQGKSYLGVPIARILTDKVRQRNSLIISFLWRLFLVLVYFLFPFFFFFFFSFFSSFYISTSWKGRLLSTSINLLCC